MTMNRVQFQPGLSTAEFMDRYGSDDKCEAALIDSRWAINTYPGNLKRSLSGTYYAVDFAKYAHRYLAEAQYRFNRRFNLRSILARLLRAACLSSPAPAHVIRGAEVGR